MYSLLILSILVTPNEDRNIFIRTVVARGKWSVRVCSSTSGAKDLLKKLIVVSKKQRYTAIDALCHPWLLTEADTVAPPGRLDDHRKNLRNDLGQEAKRNLDAYRLGRGS